MKTLLDADFLRAVQLKCNTSAKSVTPVEITHSNSGLWLMKDNRNFFKILIARKMMTKISWENFEWGKLASRKMFRHFLNANFYLFILLISNHTVFLVQFGITLRLWVFRQKAEKTLAEEACVISAFWKTFQCKLIPNWTRNRMTIHTNS